MDRQLLSLFMKVIPSAAADTDDSDAGSLDRLLEVLRKSGSLPEGEIRTLAGLVCST